jgi:hypothetical protein
MDTVTLVLRVPLEELVFLNGLLETYDDLAVVKTLDPPAGIVALLVSPGMRETAERVLDSLAGELKIERLDPADPSIVPLLEKIHALA